jgi:GT2 family glycosyltransferase
MVRVSAIIVNYNCGKKLVDTVQSVLDQSRQPDEIIIVDNGSVDGSIENLAKHSSEIIRILRSSHNLGFARAVNEAISKANGDFLLLVNCDAVLAHSYIQKLLDLMAKMNDCFAASGVILFKDTDIVWSCGSRVDTVTGFSWHISWKNRIDQLPRTIIKADTIPFTASLLRTEMLLRLGSLDEHFFMYCEDLDICLMARRKKWGVYVDTSIRAFHDIEYGRRSLSSFRYYHQLRGNLHLFIKHKDAFNLASAFIFWLGLLNVLELAIRAPPMYFVERFKAALYTLRNLEDTLLESDAASRVGKLCLEGRAKEALLIMIRHARTRGHSW